MLIFLINLFAKCKFDANINLFINISKKGINNCEMALKKVILLYQNQIAR